MSSAARDDYDVAAAMDHSTSHQKGVGGVRQGEYCSGNYLKAPGAQGKVTERKNSAPGNGQPVSNGAGDDPPVASSDHPPSHLRRVDEVCQGGYCSGNELIAQGAQ